MGFPAFMKMEGGDCQGIILLRTEFAARETGEMHPDLEQQHMEMEQFFFLHPSPSGIVSRAAAGFPVRRAEVTTLIDAV